MIYPDSTTFSAYADSLVAAVPPEPVVVLPDFKDGLEAVPISGTAGDSTLLLLILIGLAVLLMFCSSGVRRTLKTYRGEMWSLRRRPNVFDAETGVSVPVAFLLAVVCCVFAATDVYVGLTRGLNFSSDTFFKLLGIFAFFYMFKLAAYWAVGYAFAVPPGGRQWLTGYNATMAYTGLMLIPVTFVALYVNWVAQWLLIYLFSVYLVGRTIFICKGFRIFYQNFRSVFYFFLYLCALEIIPLLALAYAVMAILIS